jgi:hypothetical protein
MENSNDKKYKIVYSVLNIYNWLRFKNKYKSKIKGWNILTN